ncbi:TPA: hypothetical protein DEP58_00510 [Patescibacteria group bacterium]|nr:MAG: hypothetical protein UU98_C0026G0013 [Parcubacteria group bacterium GW2011_GWD2_42_14]HCC04770.1 hypothetical protein [Patescibacteria group bacterium]
MIAQAVALAEGENTVVVIRRHWYSLAVEGVLDVVIFLCLIGAILFLDTVALVGENSKYTDTIVPLGFFALGFFGLLLWMHFFASWSDHWLDAWIITDKRVIDIEQKGFFVRQVSSFPLDRIQDVTYTVSGIIPTWLHFGDVRMQTASISEDFIMRQVPFPQDVKEHLLSVIDTARQK